MIPKPTWFIEICLSEFHPSGMNPNYESTFKMFWQNNYEAFLVNKENTLITPKVISKWIRDKRFTWNEFNFIFIPK
jgi:hypothetical protein